MREGDDGATHDEPEGMSGADLYESRLVREYRADMARHREEMLRQDWERLQRERELEDRLWQRRSDRL